MVSWLEFMVSSDFFSFVWRDCSSATANEYNGVTEDRPRLISAPGIYWHIRGPSISGPSISGPSISGVISPVPGLTIDIAVPEGCGM